MIARLPRRRAGQATEDGLLDSLAQVSFALMAVLNRIGGENDLSLTQLRVLAILRDRRVRMSTLAEYLGLEKSTMSGLVERAEKRKLLVRSPSATDGRSMEVSISRKGAGLARRLEREIREAVAPLTGRLRPSERGRLQALLERMLGA
jgi:DNA-binding MarR family transcriptional regulator